MAPQSNREVEILLLEDNPADADLFRRSMHGRYRLTVASSGAEALDRLFHRGKYAKEKTPDIIVLDLNVPLLNGFEVLNAIKANSALHAIPVIVYSISERREDVQKAFEFGACAYLLKTSDLQQTAEALASFADFWVQHVTFPGMIRSRRAGSDAASGR